MRLLQQKKTTQNDHRNTHMQKMHLFRQAVHAKTKDRYEQKFGPKVVRKPGDEVTEKYQ
jgi:hypothetical protein